MAKSNLKFVEPSLQDQLEAAIVAAATAREIHSNTAKAFMEKYPEDLRLIGGDLSGTVLADGINDPLHPNAVHEPKSVSYRREHAKVSELQRQVREADGVVDALRAHIEATVTEEQHRAALAAAIDEAKTAARTATKLREAVDRADRAVADAQERHGEATKAVTAASEAHAQLFEAAIEQGHPPRRDSAVHDARRQVDAAADELTTARTAAAALRAKLEHAEQRLRAARSAVERNARNVVAIAVPRLLDEAKAMQLELEGRRLVLTILSAHAAGAQDAAISGYLEDVIFPYGQDGSQAADHPAVAPWLAAIEALLHDANAPLPGRREGN